MAHQTEIAALEKAITHARAKSLRAWRELHKAVDMAYRQGVDEKEVSYVGAKRVLATCSKAETAAVNALNAIHDDAFKKNRVAARHKYGCVAEPPKTRAAKAGGQ